MYMVIIRNLYVFIFEIDKYWTWKSIKTCNTFPFEIAFIFITGKTKDNITYCTILTI